ncbi:MAG: hypothetical protein LBQ93_04430 [Treponema sp.]|jgi:hypothetical protein|nr:hypothetical protein [Treponema sp.]
MAIRKKVVCIILGSSIILACVFIQLGFINKSDAPSPLTDFNWYQTVDTDSPTFGQGIESELTVVLADFLRFCDNFSHVELDERIDELRNFLNQQDKRVEMSDDGIIYYVNDLMLTGVYLGGWVMKMSAGLGVQYSFHLYKNNDGLNSIINLYVITPKEEQHETIRNSSRDVPKYLIVLYPKYYYLYLEEGQIICRVLTFYH